MADMGRLLKKWEEEFKNEKKTDTAEIYNKIAEVCKSYADNSLDAIFTALELVKQTIALKKLKTEFPELFEPKAEKKQ